MTHIFVVPADQFRLFLTPIINVIAQIVPKCTSESARDLLETSANLMDIMSERLVEPSSVEESLGLEYEDRDFIDLKDSLSDVEIEVARLCSLVVTDEIEDLYKAWLLIIRAFRAFDNAICAYTFSTYPSLKNGPSRNLNRAENQGLFANYPIINKTKH